MSSNPGYRPPQRIVPIPYAGYRTCAKCEQQFYTQDSRQVTCRLCQVNVSVKPVAISQPRPCLECGQLFTPAWNTSRAKYCNDPETDCRAKVKARRKDERRCLEIAATADAPLLWESPPGDTPCVMCGRGFTPGRSAQVTCNSRCSLERLRQRNREAARRSHERKKQEANHD